MVRLQASRLFPVHKAALQYIPVPVQYVSLHLAETALPIPTVESLGLKKIKHANTCTIGDYKPKESLSSVRVGNKMGRDRLHAGEA
jgi:hypothetical protein